MDSTVIESIDLSFNYDNTSDRSLVDLWRLTNSQLVYSKFSSKERLNNRSWRLLNRKILMDSKLKKASSSSIIIKDLSEDSLSDLKLNRPQTLTNRPSLFSNGSGATLFSHNSKINLSEEDSNNPKTDNDSSDDISDILEEEDFYSGEDNEDYESQSIENSETKKIEAGNQPETNSSFGHPYQETDSKGQSLHRSRTSFVRGFSPNNVFISSSSTNIRKSSLAALSDHNSFSSKGVTKPANNQTSKNIFYIANSPSPPNQNEQPTDEHTPPKSNLEDSSAEITYEKMPSTMKRQDSLFSNFQFQSKSVTMQNKGNDEEDEDYTSTDISEDEDEDEEDEDIDESEDEEQQPTQKYEPKEKVDVIVEDDGKADDNDSEWLSISSEDEKLVELEYHPLKFDKRVNPLSNNSSVSTDIASNSQNKVVSSPPSGKPRSLLSGLFLNEMGSNSAQTQSSHFPFNSKPILKRSSTTGIITVDQNKNNNSKQIRTPSILFSKKYASSADISRNYPHYHNNLIKNTILDDCSSDQDEDEGILGKQKSIVGISDFNVTTKSSSSTNSNNDNNNGHHDALSSSLNKYSVSVSNHSLKNLISKSSLSLTSIFNNSKAKFTKYNESSEKLEQQKSNPQRLDSLTSLRNSDKSIDLITPNSDSLTLNTTPMSDTPTKNNVAHSKFIKLSPKSTRRSMLSTELSKSLKESIIIDYKLGKIPLPSKVINKDEVLKSSEHLNEELDDIDDYHSKGW